MLRLSRLRRNKKDKLAVYPPTPITRLSAYPPTHQNQTTRLPTHSSEPNYPLTRPPARTKLPDYPPIRLKHPASDNQQGIRPISSRFKTTVRPSLRARNVEYLGTNLNFFEYVYTIYLIFLYFCGRKVL